VLNDQKQLVQDIQIPDHPKSGKICLVFKWLVLVRNIHKQIFFLRKKTVYLTRPFENGTRIQMVSPFE
jgi:hypothetical protein